VLRISDIGKALEQLMLKQDQQQNCLTQILENQKQEQTVAGNDLNSEHYDLFAFGVVPVKLMKFRDRPPDKHVFKYIFSNVLEYSRQVSLDLGNKNVSEVDFVQSKSRPLLARLAEAKDLQDARIYFETGSHQVSYHTVEYHIRGEMGGGYIFE